MGGRRTDLVSKRDVEVLEFIARFGVVPRGAVATWAATGKTATLNRERRLRLEGLVEVRRGVWGEGKLLAATREGLAVCRRGELRPARFALASVDHESAIAELAAMLEQRGLRTLSEREIGARERAEGRRILSAQLGSGHYHRADLICWGGGGHGAGGDRGRADREGRGKARSDPSRLAPRRRRAPLQPRRLPLPVAHPWRPRARRGAHPHGWGD